MDSLEERNLNRLRKGKMMLEYSERKRSPIYSFILACFFGCFGAHRFYLGHKLLGAILLLSTIILGTAMILLPTELVGYFIGVFMMWIVIEVVLAPVFTSSANRKIKKKLMTKYKVEEVV